MPRNVYQQCLTTVCVLAALQGCESGSRDAHPHETVPPSINKPISAIPGNARVVVATPSQLTFRAPDDGMVYLYDVADKTTVDHQKIARGQTYEVMLERSMVKVGERTAPVTALQPLAKGREYRVYFSRDTEDADD